MVKFDLSDEGFIRIGTHYDQKDRCAAVPGGRWVPRLRMWEYLLTPSTASALHQTFHREMDDEVRQKLQNYSSRLSIARSVKNGDCELQIPVTSIDPWHHQLITYHMVRQLFGLDDEDDSCSAGAMAALDMGPQPLHAKILTPVGWTTMNNIQVDDFVIGSDGLPTRVTHIIPHGVDDIYEVTFSDHATTQCTKDHLWSIISPRDKWQKKKFRSFSLEKIKSYGLRNTSKKNKYWRWFIPVTEPIEFHSCHKLPIDPYVLGVLIGDGALTQGVRFTTADEDILANMKNILHGYSINQYSKYQYGIVTEKGKQNNLWNLIKKLKLNVKSENKHIPSEYLFASITDRISLLRGLLDTDGNINDSIEYSSSSKQLALDVQALVRSLGGTATMNCKKTSCLDSYRIHLRMPPNINPFKLKRKADKYKGTNPTRSFRNIKYIGKMDTKCIRVEATDGLYITDDFIVTHNCGKSKCAVDIICNYPDKIRKVLIVCPMSVIDVWTGNEKRCGQFEIHTTKKQFKNLCLCPIKGIDMVRKARAAELVRYKAMHEDKQFIAVVNYESVWREPLASWIQDVGFDLVVLDEIHRIKSPGGKASKFFGTLARKTKYRLGLTGTPLPHSILDIYGQYRFLDPGIFGTSFTKFRSEYAILDNRQTTVSKINEEGELEQKKVDYGVVLGYRNADRLHDKMFLIAHRVMSKDVFDLPEFQSEIRTCELSREERKIYDQMDKEFYVEVKEGLVTADNALVKLLRLQEITSGYLDKQPIGDSKKKLLADVIEDFDVREPLVVFARFTNDLKAIKEIVEGQGRVYCELSGNKNELAKWQNGEGDVLGVQIKSGSVGVDLTRARYSIYYSLGFSLGDYEQSIKRIDRPGQTRQGMYIHLLAENTVDFKVMDALEKRQEVIASVLTQYMEDVPDFDEDNKKVKHGKSIQPVMTN